MDWESPPSVLVTRNLNWSLEIGYGDWLRKGKAQLHGLGQTWPFYMGWAEHGPNAWAGEKNEARKKKVISDTPTAFEVHVPPIMKEKIERNWLRRWKRFFDRQKLQHPQHKELSLLFSYKRGPACLRSTSDPRKMSSSLLELSLLSLCLLYGSIFSLIAQASVPPSARFQIPVDTFFGEYSVEYGANYRLIGIDNYPFQLSFYNTPLMPSLSLSAWETLSHLQRCICLFVDEANRGKPVRVNATLTLSEDGNLVLADVDGSIAWQTYTAQKGVVGFQLLPNGNMVLHDSKGSFVWQSFDHPTDTLLAGQSLRLEGTARLVSRASEKQNSDGPYSLVLEPKRLAMYYKSPSSPRPYLYYTPDKLSESKGRIQSVTLYSRGEVDGFYYDFALSTPFQDAILTTVNYNNTLSFLRLGIDGNI
ncbi:hypothetical protein NC651_023501 [Populus alba x Populus x berolinensis]|nr:hypothetical protein NC651_023501 [Populus alba x Populus x berolinensis]